jgi:L-alanine-DL-glutamate epimerase-like enolase superfamily enzyme
MIGTARELGLQIMIGSMNESSIGTAAMVHLLPAVDHADADGPLLLSADLAGGLTFSEGKISVTDTPGLGISTHLAAQ